MLKPRKKQNTRCFPPCTWAARRGARGNRSSRFLRSRPEEPSKTKAREADRGSRLGPAKTSDSQVPHQQSTKKNGVLQHIDQFSLWQSSKRTEIRTYARFCCTSPLVSRLSAPHDTATASPPHATTRLVRCSRATAVCCSGIKACA